MVDRFGGITKGENRDGWIGGWMDGNPPNTNVAIV